LNSKQTFICIILVLALLTAAAPAQGSAEKKSLDDYVQALQDKDVKVRNDAAWSLGKMGDPKAVDPLVGALADKESSVRDWAVLALAKIGKPSTDALIAALRREGAKASPVRAQAAGALGLIKDAKAVEPLILALKDGDNDTRYWAAIALGMINDSRAEDPLIQTLADGNAQVREEAGRAIRAIKGHQAAEIFKQLLSDSNSSMRRGAAGALGDSQDEGAFEPLVQAMHDESAMVRSEAAKSLGKLNNTSAIGPLMQALIDDEKGVRSEAASALAKIGEPAVEPLIGALQDNDSSEAARALGEIGDVKAIDPLIQAFKSNNSDTRQEVVLALVRLNGTSAVLPFIQILRDPKEKRGLRMDAAMALGELGDAKARTALLEAMSDSDTQIQLSAAKSLTKLGKKGPNRR
jgi:HEAT repeat protein